VANADHHQLGSFRDHERKTALCVLRDLQCLTLTDELVNELFPRIWVVVHDQHVGLFRCHGRGSMHDRCGSVHEAGLLAF
jgi:hypothetical protein